MLVLTTTGMHDATITGVATFASADAAPLQRTVLLPDVSGSVPSLITRNTGATLVVHCTEDGTSHDVGRRLGLAGGLQDE